MPSPPAGTEETAAGTMAADAVSVPDWAPVPTAPPVVVAPVFAAAVPAPDHVPPSSAVASVPVPTVPFETPSEPPLDVPVTSELLPLVRDDAALFAASCSADAAAAWAPLLVPLCAGMAEKADAPGRALTIAPSESAARSWAAAAEAALAPAAAPRDALTAAAHALVVFVASW